MSLKTKIEDNLPFYNDLVKPVHFIKALAAGVKYGFPGKGLKVIGVTGTNGKTTTSFMIWKMLNESGRKTGILTTVAWGVEKLEPELNHMTTVDSMTLNSRLKKIREQGAEYVVLEVTSHAMSQFRTLGIPIEVAVFTNLTHEHLDYHKTMENYRDAKRKLFQKAKFGVINADDSSSRYFRQDVREWVDYGLLKGKKRAEKVKLGVSGVEYEVSGLKIKTKIPGKFNVYNSLAAVCVGERLGLTEEEIQKGIFSLEEVEGRMNRIQEGQDFEVIVDYAHTPDAIEKVFEAVKEHKGKKIAVHGGAGRRDETTRAERGEILGREADVVIITEDDSRDEDPEEIAKMFLSGVEKTGKKLGKDVFIEIDREKAIKMALQMAKKGDLVLILGKGHEKTILRKEGPVPFEDIKVVKKLLKAN